MIIKKSPSIKEGDVIVRVNPRYFRPAEVDNLIGDSSKARKILGWKPEVTLEEMCQEMMQNDIEGAKKRSLLKEHGFKVTEVPED